MVFPFKISKINKKSYRALQKFLLENEIYNAYTARTAISTLLNEQFEITPKNYFYTAFWWNPSELREKMIDATIPPSLIKWFHINLRWEQYLYFYLSHYYNKK